MAEGLFLVYKSNAADPSAQLVDGIHAVLVNSDDGSTTAEIIADAIASCVAGGHALPSGYFDTVNNIDSMSAGLLPTDLDVCIFLPRGIQTVLHA